LEIEQLGQNPAVAPDKLRVHTGDIHLAQRGEPTNLAARAQEFPGLVVTLEPGPGGDLVGPDEPAADLLVFDAQRAGAGPLPFGDPRLGSGEPCADLGRRGAAQRDVYRND
jgi:hypothetical protein